MRIPLVLAGATGRMGQAILGLAAQDPEIEIVAALERTGHPQLGKPLAPAFPVPLTDDARAALAPGRILVDFTQPEASLAYLEAARERGASLVLGTTGFSETEKTRIRDAAKSIPLMQAANYSVGMNLLFALVEEAAAVLGTAYDVEIIEAHHRMKKDAPSGSALSLGEAVARAWGRNLSDLAVHGREGKVGERPEGKIGFHAVRGGDIVGDHTVLYAGAGERLELKHVAHSRETLARGAVRAAKWLSGKLAGLYDMSDVLNLKKPS